MSTDGDNFLHRWARRKRESAKAQPRPAVPEVPAPELPPVESLDFESDFGAFLRAKVDEGVRRAALRKLFSDPRFNIMDGLDIYIEDYSKEDPIPAGLLAQLEHVRSTLLGPRQKVDSAEAGTQPLQSSSNAPPQTYGETQHESETES